MRQRDGRGPEGEAVRDAPLQLAQEAVLVLARDDGADVKDRPLTAAGPEAVLVERKISGGGA